MFYVMTRLATGYRNLSTEFPELATLFIYHNINIILGLPVPFKVVHKQITGNEDLLMTLMMAFFISFCFFLEVLPESVCAG